MQKTTDYQIFKPHPLNRKIDQGNLVKITNSLKAKNMLCSVPILVDSEMRVIDGNHRLAAAKALGLEIYYQIISSATDEDMILLNSAQKKWSLEDYVNFYAAKGKKPY